MTNTDGHRFICMSNTGWYRYHMIDNALFIVVPLWLTQVGIDDFACLTQVGIGIFLYKRQCSKQGSIWLTQVGIDFSICLTLFIVVPLWLTQVGIDDFACLTQVGIGIFLYKRQCSKQGSIWLTQVGIHFSICLTQGSIGICPYKRQGSMYLVVPYV